MNNPFRAFKKITPKTFTLAMSVLLIALMIVTVASCGVIEEFPPDDAIMPERAQEIALTHAGLNTADVRMDRAEYDLENGKPTYEIEFRAGHTEYDYVIHARTGEILAHHSERDRD